MALESGLDPLVGPWQVLLDDLGGDAVDLTALGITLIEGLEDVPEIDADDAETAGDSDHLGNQRLTSRELTITVTPRPTDEDDPADWTEEEWADWAQAAAETVKAAIAPQPDRSKLRMLRFILPGMAQARRLYYRPAVGRPLRIVTTVESVLFARKTLEVRLDCPDPIVVSDEYHSQTFTAGQTHTLVNAGTFCGVNPTGWWLEAPGPVRIEHLDWPGESIVLPAGPVTVSRHREVSGPGGRSDVTSGNPANWLPGWPLMRPGENRFKASAACTIFWRDQWP